MKVRAQFGLDANALTLNWVPVFVVRAVFNDCAYALAEVVVPNLVCGAWLCDTNTLAEVVIPGKAVKTTFRLTEALTYLSVPVVARRAHLRPFAQALALLPVPELVIRADHRIITLALAGNWVPNLEFRAGHLKWADASARIKAEVAGRDAFNSLLALTEAGEWIPIVRMDAIARYTPAGIPRYDDIIIYYVVIRNNNIARRTFAIYDLTIR